MIAKRVTNWLIKYEVIKEEESKLYEYALKTLSYLFAPVIISFLVGMMYARILESLVMVIPYMIIRIFSGGFHMKTLRGCLVFSTILYVMIFSLGLKNIGIGIFCCINIFCTISISILSPIESTRKKLIINRKCYYKKMSIILSGCISIVIFVMFIFGNDYYARYVTLGMLLASLLQWFYILLNRISTD